MKILSERGVKRFSQFIDNVKSRRFFSVQKFFAFLRLIMSAKSSVKNKIEKEIVFSKAMEIEGLHTISFNQSLSTILHPRITWTVEINSIPTVCKML